MPQSYTTTAPRQLHTLLPGPDGTHACLSVYDACPHTTPSTHCNSRPKAPYLDCALPPVPSPPSTRTIEYVDRQGRRMLETIQTTLTHHPKEKAMAASLAPLVLSKHSPVLRHIRASTAAPVRSVLKHSALAMPSIYLLTFSTDRCASTRSVAALLDTHLPHRMRLLYTIDARAFLVPPRGVCDAFSGVAAAVQEEVMRDERARVEVECAVDDLAKFVQGGGGETAVAVCCTAGTHRSVAIAELIARGVRDEVRRAGTDVKVVVRHVHRVRGPKDPY